MKWTKKGFELEEFNKNWQNVKEVAVFGFGQIGKSFIRQIKDDINILYIIDNDKIKSGESFFGISVLHISEINPSKCKILVSSYYEDISKQLISLGLKEDIDFCDINKFVCSWYWYNFKKVHLPEVHTALTTKCTLNCKNCNMYIPYHKNNGEHQPLESIISSVDKLFTLTDKVYRFAILGGEPFLYPNLKEIILHFDYNYRQKIGELSIVTNGTIIPSDEILKLIAKKNIVISISDYTNSLKYKEKLEKFKNKLDKFNINYKISGSDFWLDFNFPHKPLKLPNETVINHMHSCSPVFKGINDNKFYYCHIVWSAIKSGLLKDDSNDYLDLEDINPAKDIDKLALIENNLGFMPKGYVSLCKMCGGCAKDNSLKVLPALQMDRIH